MRVVTLISLSAIGVAVALSATAALGHEGREVARPQFDAASSFNPIGEKASRKDLELLVDTLQDEVGGPNPTRSEVSLASGTVVVSDFANHPTAFEGEKGQVCFVGRQLDTPRFSGCAPTFTEGGVIPAYSTDTLKGPELHGLVSSDVTSITIETADGKTHEVDPRSGGFWWTGKSSDRVTALDTVRDGKIYRLTSIFEEPSFPQQ